MFQDGAYYCYCAYISSACLHILRSSIGDAHQYRDIFTRFTIMQRIQISVSTLGIQKENCNFKLDRSRMDPGRKHAKCEHFKLTQD